jgi:Tfp pilus assembly protein PilN
MPQQINLCAPILLTQKRYFSAQTMAQALAIFALVGGALAAYGVWSLNQASDGFRKTLETQAIELKSLQAAIEQNKSGAGPAEAVLTQDLQTRKIELQQRQALQAELQRGLFKPGWGHAARLQLLAQSIPAKVWITEVRADENQLQVSGLTLEPAALNDWVARLAGSPLLLGQKLATVKVENVKGLAASEATGSVRPSWSFNLVSALGKPTVSSEVKP